MSTAAEKFALENDLELFEVDRIIRELAEDEED